MAIITPQSYTVRKRRRLRIQALVRLDMTREAVYVQRNIKAPSRDYCWCGKAVIIKCVCVCVRVRGGVRACACSNS